MKLYKENITYETQDIIKSFIDLAQKRMDDVRKYGPPCVPHVSLGAGAGHTQALLDDHTYSATSKEIGKPLIVVPTNSTINDIKRCGYRGVDFSSVASFKRNDSIRLVSADLLSFINLDCRWRGLRQVRPIIFDSISENDFYLIMSKLNEMIILTEVPYILRVGRA